MRNKIFYVMFCCVLVTGFTSCVRPYDRPEYVNVSTDQTAFVIPLFTDVDIKTDDQIVVNSEEYYKERKVNEKLVSVPHKWVKTGRTARSGYYAPMLKVVAVSNSPVSGTWTDEIKVETKGSQGIKVPMKYTIRVEPHNAAKFLSKFPADITVADENGKIVKSKMVSSVKRVADGQFKDYVAGVLSEEFHKYEYKDVNNARDKIISDGIVRVKEWADEYGITIDNLAVFDGLIFEDKTLQTQIDEQAKLAAETETEKRRQEKLAQEKRNEIELAKLEKEKIEVERQNKEARARMTVSEQQILSQTSNIELARKLKEQEIENLKLKGKAEAQAIITKAERFDMPATLIVTPEFSNALGISEIMKQ